MVELARLHRNVAGTGGTGQPDPGGSNPPPHRPADAHLKKSRRVSGKLDCALPCYEVNYGNPNAMDMDTGQAIEDCIFH